VLNDDDDDTVASAYGSRDMVSGFHDAALVASPDIGGVQGEYLSVSAGGNDAICIAYISMVWPDGIKHVWIGDIGSQCNTQRYESQLEINNDHLKSKCIWIDGDGRSGSGPNEIGFSGFGIHMTDFVASSNRANDYKMDNALMCKSTPRFHMYEKLSINDRLPYFDPPLSFDANGRDLDRSKVLVTGSIRPAEGVYARGQIFPRKEYHKVENW
jgi:hypothetical protein